MKNNLPRPVLFASNAVATLGYISLLLQLLWLTIIYLPGLLENESFKNIFLPNPSVEQPAHTSTASLADNPLALVGVGILTIVMIILTIYLLIKLPSAVARSGHKVTSEVTQVAVPIITHHKNVSVAKRRTLTFRISFAIKFIFTLLAYLTLFIPVDSTQMLESGIIWSIGSILASSTLLWFGVQFVLAKAFSLPPECIR